MEKANKIATILIENYSREEHIHYDSPFKVLVRCIISQRNRDEVTDRVAELLFEQWSTPEDIAKVSVKEMQDFLSDLGLGLYNSKGKWIVNAAQRIIKDYDGSVPEDTEKLLDIKGIGRKCMNIIMAYGFGNPAIPVDTHVDRVSKRLGLVEKGATTRKVEKKLKKKISKDQWFYLNHAMVDHGQTICKPQNPRCDKCPVKQYCGYYAEKRK